MKRMPILVFLTAGFFVVCLSAMHFHYVSEKHFRYQKKWTLDRMREMHTAIWQYEIEYGVLPYVERTKQDQDPEKLLAIFTAAETNANPREIRFLVSVSNSQYPFWFDAWSKPLHV